MLKDMKMDKAQQEKAGPAMAEPPKQEYPWGLRINLDHATMEKLGLSEMPKVGDVFALDAKAIVKSSHESQTEDSDKPNRSLELQITELAVDPDEEDEKPADKLYKPKEA